MEIQTKVCGIKRAAQILDLSEDRLRKLTKQGRVPSYRDDGGRFKYVVKDMKRLARQRASQQAER